MQLKGRVACEINTCDELIATEMVFENVLESLDPPEIAGWSGSMFLLVSVRLPREKDFDTRAACCRGFRRLYGMPGR